LAWTLFSTAYLRTAGELDDIRSRHRDFPGAVPAMVTHFCRLYDAAAPLFRFMLISQHDLLRRLTREQRTAVDAVADTVTAAVQAGEIAAVDGAAAAAVIIGIVLQTAIFHIYGTLSGGLTERAPALACTAIAAVTALAEPPRGPRHCPLSGGCALGWAAGGRSADVRFAGYRTPHLFATAARGDGPGVLCRDHHRDRAGTVCGRDQSAAGALIQRDPAGRLADRV